MMIGNALKSETEQLSLAYDANYARLQHQLARLANSEASSPQRFYATLLAREQLTREFEADLLRLRYTKGLDLIRLLNEKVLSLDYHFSSLQTVEEISSISNPNSYPRFVEFIKEVETENSNQQRGSALTSFNQGNPYISAITSITALLTRKKPPTAADHRSAGVLVSQ